MKIANLIVRRIFNRTVDICEALIYGMNQWVYPVVGSLKVWFEFFKISVYLTEPICFHTVIGGC